MHPTGRPGGNGNCDLRARQFEADKAVMSCNRRLLSLAGIIVALLSWAGPAHAYDFSRNLRPGDSGRDVRALQVRVAGWYPTGKPKRFLIDGAYGSQTDAAVRRFQRHDELEETGVADKKVFAILNALQDADGS